MVTKGYALIDAATDKIVATQIPTDTTFDVVYKSVQVGYAGQSGELKLYSEQGGTDYTATLKPNAAMTANSDFFLPLAHPAGTQLLTMTAMGLIEFDASVYVDTTTGQNVGGVKTFTSFPLTPNAMPSANLEVANKQYVDSVAVGLTPKASCRVATVGALPACTYLGTPNFTLTGDVVGALADQDGVTLVQYDRVLVKNQATQKNNGIYEVTTVGTPDPGGTAFVLTRTSDYNSTAEVESGTFTYIEEGTANAGYQFIQTTASPTLDTDALVFGILYAPLAETLNTVTTRGATTTNAITVGGVANTKALHESSIKDLVFGLSPYTVLATDRVIHADATGGNVNILLPPATGSGRRLDISKRDASLGTVTITADTTGTPDLIDGSATKVLYTQYDSKQYLDCHANEWSNIARSADVAQNTYRVSVSGSADFTSIGACITYLNSLSTTDGVRVVVDGGTYDVPSTVAVNATMPITIEGSGIGSTILSAVAGLVGSNMFTVASPINFTRLSFDGTVAGWQAGANASFVKITANGLDCIFDFFSMDTCKRGIEITGNSNIIAVDFIIENASVAGVEANATGAVGVDVEIGNLVSCATGVHLLKSSAGNVFLDTLRFTNGLGNTSILYVPATFTYTNFTIGSCEYNYVGTFMSGFDFTRTDGRDANIVVTNNVGEENKQPHAKINLAGNTTVTSLSSNTWTKATFINTSYYTAKWTIANNRMTYQPLYPKDVMMWLSGSVYISTNGTKELGYAIVKNGTAPPTPGAVVYGQGSITIDQNGRKFNFSTNVYLDDVTNGSFFELWVRNITNGDDPVIADLNWLVDSR